MTNNQKLEFYSIATIKTGFENGLQFIKTAKSKKAYLIALDLLNGFDENIELGVRKNASGLAYNIGDIGECLVKYVNGVKRPYVSPKGENDLNSKTMNEVKTFTVSNRPPNELTEPIGFYSVSELGVRYIPKELIVKYWDMFQTKDNKKVIKLKDIKYLIKTYNIKKLTKYNQIG